MRGPLLAERVELGYRYCTRPECQAPHHRGTVVTAIGNNKSADTLIVADPEEIARRSEAGEFARKDTGWGSTTAPAVRSPGPARPVDPDPPAGTRPRPYRARGGAPTKTRSCASTTTWA